jgi:hypothetical protein
VTRIAVAMTALWWVFPPLHMAAAQPVALPRRPHVSVSIKRVRLELSLPTRRYPYDSLIRATVTITNLTNHPVELDKPFSHGTDNPEIEVLSPKGKVVYPPVFPDFEMGGEVGDDAAIPHPPITLAPRSTVTRHVYAIADGSGIRARSAVTNSLSSTEVITPRLSLQLYAKQPMPLPR